MFEVQKLFYLANGLDHFKEELQKIGVDVRDYPEHQMMLLDYNMIECVKNHPVVNECRGLMIDYSGNIVRKAFNRFYNFGENGVDTFDFANSIAYEKADGSLMFVYFCPATNQWEIGTRGTAFAEGPNEFHGTFRKFMLAAMGRTEAEFQDDCVALSREYTYLFEAVGPDNRIVTPYKTNHLVELASVHNYSGHENLCRTDTSDLRFLSGFPNWNVRKIREYKFNTQEDCMVALAELDGLQEGYVVYNPVTKERVKIKNAVYLAAHRLRGNGLTMNSICELVAMNEVDEYLATFPEDAEKFIPAQDLMRQIHATISATYALYEDIESQKDFALKVKDLDFSCVYFTARKLKCTAIHAFNSYPVSRRADWLKERLQGGAV